MNMKTSKTSTHRKSLAVGATALAVVLASVACTDSDSDTGATTTPSPAVSTTTAAGESTAAHNQADVMFAQMMIPHHSQAIEMSDMLLAKQGVPEPVTALAQQIKAAQGPEIDQLTAWLAQWGEPAQRQGGMGHEMKGMMGEQDMRALSTAQGTEAARLFLNQMIAHHEGAIDMAETEIEDGQFPDAVAMARTIADTQQQEIDTMRQLLTTL